MEQDRVLRNRPWLVQKPGTCQMALQMSGEGQSPGEMVLGCAYGGKTRLDLYLTAYTAACKTQIERGNLKIFNRKYAIFM